MVPAESPSIAHPPPEINIANEVNVFFEEVLGIFFNRYPWFQDTEALKALSALYDALHDPSVLDARRHIRYGLYPPVVPKTPIFVSTLRI